MGKGGASLDGLASLGRLWSQCGLQALNFWECGDEHGVGHVCTARYFYNVSLCMPLKYYSLLQKLLHWTIAECTCTMTRHVTHLFCPAHTPQLLLCATRHCKSLAGPVRWGHPRGAKLTNGKEQHLAHGLKTARCADSDILLHLNGTCDDSFASKRCCC